MSHGPDAELHPGPDSGAGHRPDVRDLLAGIAILCSCAALAWTASTYGIGTPRRMGPGFFPFYLGIIGTGLGALMIARAFVAPLHAGTEVPLRRLLFISAAFLLFAVAIEPMGLILTVIGTTLLGAFADKEARPLQSLLLAIGLAAAIWVLFVLLLGLSIPVWPGA